MYSTDLSPVSWFITFSDDNESHIPLLLQPIASVRVTRCVQRAKRLRETYYRTTVNTCLVLSPVRCVSPAPLNFGIEPRAFDCPSISPQVCSFPVPATRVQCTRREDAWETPAPLLSNFGTVPGAFRFREKSKSNKANYSTCWIEKLFSKSSS